MDNDNVRASDGDGAGGMDIGHIDDFPTGTMHLRKVDGRRFCVIRTSDGIHALDHACPHEEYGLTQGLLSDGILTCAWHNWKFRVSDGTCLVGEEDVQVHATAIDALGRVRITPTVPDPAVLRPRYEASLERGIERNYVGQISRDTLRLLRLDADPADLVWRAVAFGAPRAEFGWGHSIAVAADCLSMLDDYTGLDRALPIVQAIAGVAEEERGRPRRTLANPLPVLPQQPGRALRAHFDAEELDEAQALVRGAIHAGVDADRLHRWLAAAVADHHLSYGHGAIYVQKAFELLRSIGWDHADAVLANLVPTIVYGTREDTLPYMVPFMRRLRSIDLAALHEVPAAEAWSDDGALLRAILDTPDRTAALDAAIGALRRGAGVDRLLDVVVDASAERLLRYDTAGEDDLDDDFGWLDITHALTYANAARYHHDRAPGPETVRLALFTVFLAHWTGRHEWHTRIAEPFRTPAVPDLSAAATGLRHASLLDPCGSFIVQAHAIKLSVAASAESLRSGCQRPIDAAHRFLAAPKRERFVASNVAQAQARLRSHEREA